MNTPELLAPAGSLDKMRAAYRFGADAVYAGQPRYSLRVRNNDFDHDTLATGIAEAHALGKRFYLASNLLAHNAKLKTYLADIEPVIAMAPDALIMADPGLIMWVRERWPDMPVHLSVQANTMNWAAVRFWQSLGIRRVILSRELSLNEVEEIRQRCPDMEIEVFVHGALCIAYSGRCLLTGYFNHRDANQGSCTNSCRWDYFVHPAGESPSGDIVPIQLIEERTRPGQLMPIEEDEHGTYILNSKDLRAVEHVARLVAIGVDSLKIEGRTKSAYYVARACQAYRRAIDDAGAGRAFDPTLLDALDGLASRGYTDGFFVRHKDRDHQNYASGLSAMGNAQYVGDVVSQRDGLAEVRVKNRFGVGDRLEIVHPAGNRIIEVVELRDAQGAAIEVAPGSGHTVYLFLPPDCNSAMLARLAPPEACSTTSCS
jgi:putative protease